MEPAVWDQFIIEKEDETKLLAQYDFAAIPLVVFTDQHGKILKRETGSSSNAVEEFGSFIRKELQ